MDFEEIPPDCVDESWNWIEKNCEIILELRAHIKPGGVVAVVRLTAGKQFSPDLTALTAGENNTWVWGSSRYLWSGALKSSHGQILRDKPRCITARLLFFRVVFETNINGVVEGDSRDRIQFLSLNIRAIITAWNFPFPGPNPDLRKISQFLPCSNMEVFP